MNLENIVTSLKMSRKLDEKGVNLDTCFWWRIIPPLEDELLIDDYKPTKISSKTNIYKAYTFQQLWDVLPLEIHYEFDIPDGIPEWGVLKVKAEKSLLMSNGVCKITFIDLYRVTESKIFFRNSNGSNAAAEALIWCLDNDYITLEEVNSN